MSVQLLVKIFYYKNQFNFKLRIIVRHVSCTIDVRQFLPLSKVFQKIYSTANETASYFWKYFLNLMQTRKKWKEEHELFLKKKVFPMEIVLHVCVNSVFNQNSMYVKMKCPKYKY